MRTSHVTRPALARLGLALCCLFVASSCSNISTTSAPGFDFDTIGTYAWEAPPRVAPDEDPDVEAALQAELQQAIEARLAALGVQKAPAASADVLIDVNLTVSLEIMNNDPYFNNYVAEKYEDGHMTIRLQDPATGDQLWSGEKVKRLRYVSRTLGGSAPRWVPTGEERRWPIEEMVDKLLTRAARD